MNKIVYHKHKTLFLSFFLMFFLPIGFLQAQGFKPNTDVEKIYLHTDRSRYYLGEDLWFKAYDVKAFNNTLFDNSNILYVELISSDSKIIARNKINLEMGLGRGDFKLTDSIGVKEGVYQLRAYTNWNRNFGDDFVFKKDIKIVRVFDDGSKTGAQVVQSNSDVIKALTTDKQKTNCVDFFPEGGSLLENVASVVGFKAVDINGNPLEISGEIFDSNDEWVAAIASVHDGMGKFQMIPNEGKTYYAKVKLPNGNEIKIELPKPQKQGYSLNFRVYKGKNIVTISTNSATLAQNPNEVLTLIGKARGVSYFETTVKLTDNTLSLELPVDKAPEGISQITLLDSNSKPHSERLVYIAKENDLDVQLLADKTSYKTNEKTTINVISKSKTGVPKSASFSLSVTDLNGADDTKDKSSNICSYFLMESDIRGKVVDPAYYFDPANPKRLDHLDNLLLTQGWRDFVWKTLPIVIDNLTYRPEKGIVISGRLKQLLADKPLENINMTLALMNKKNFNILNTNTDSNGNFKFENLLFSGKTTMFLNSRDAKGKFRGEILLNPLELPALQASFSGDKESLPETNLATDEYVRKKFISLGIPVNILDEVQIKQKKPVAIAPVLGLPDFSYVPNEDLGLYTDIYQLMEQTIPGVTVSGETVVFTKNNAEPLFVINGITVIDKLQLNYILPIDVVRIDVIKSQQATLYYGNDGANGVIAISTNPSAKKPAKKDFDRIQEEITGFNVARVFYSPNPEKPNLILDEKIATRNTIYWNPYVHPDATGNVNVNYFNSSVETKVKVVLEGITGSGIPVAKKAYYTIKK